MIMSKRQAKAAKDSEPFIFGEHNMWFVRNDLLGRSAADPLVSWRGMVRLYWAQFGSFGCLHFRFWLYLHCVATSLL